MIAQNGSSIPCVRKELGVHLDIRILFTLYLRVESVSNGYLYEDLFVMRKITSVQDGREVVRVCDAGARMIPILFPSPTLYPHVRPQNRVI